MQLLSRPSAYALAALARLAAGAPARLAASQLARELGLPAPYLAKLLQPLVGAGLLESRRGVGGGFCLAVDPAGLALLRVVEVVEGGWRRQCPLGWPECRDERPCPLHPVWGEMHGRMGELLARTHLADLVRRPT
jgi:Rrf2 family protein